MTKTHQRVESRGAFRLLVALGLTLVMMCIELAAGWFSGSLALLADAAHMLTDASMLALSVFAAWISTRPANPQKTYGYYRTEILAALANGIVLWVIVVWIYGRAFQRLHAPIAVLSNPMVAVAFAGLLINLLSGWVLMKDRSGNLNIHGAWLNVMSDAVGSLGVIIAGLAIRWYHWHAADAIAGMVIGVLIAVNSWNLVGHSVNILLEGTPAHLQVHDIVGTMRAVPGVREVHDVHLWTITTGMDSMSGHVIVDDVGKSAEILLALNALLSARFGITHTTLQLEPFAHVCETGHPPTSEA